MAQPLFRFANLLYRHAFPVYRPMYAAYKACTDREARAHLRRFLKPGMAVLDIGANIGVYTCLFSRAVGASGSVIAFEPSPENHRRLLQATRGLDNVTTVCAAVGDSTGRTKLYVSDDLNVDHRTYDAGSGADSHEIDMVRIDDWVTPGRGIDFIKIDVQGYELQVLRGATRVLRENPQMRLFMEFWPSGLRQAGVTPTELLEAVYALGFSVFRIDGSPFPAGELERLALRNDDGYFDCLIARDTMAQPDGASC